LNAQTIIGVGVFLVWAVSYIAGVLNSSYDPPIEINAVMLIVAGFFFGGGLKKKGKGPDEPN
jgi:hypothetical protein